MRTQLITIIVLTAFIACQTRQVDDNNLSKLQSSIIDSLEKHLATDSLFKRRIASFYVGKENEHDFGFYQLSDSTTLVYQKHNRNWQITDTLPFKLTYVQTTDLNGDNYKDIVITYNITGAGGNGENVSLIYYPNLRQFVHNHYFDLPNLSYDTATNLIHSAWWGSSNHPQNKMIYTITGDSLTFKEGVTYIPEEQTQGDIGTVEFYTMQSGSRLVKKQTTGKSNITFDIFTSALWDTSDQ